MTLIGFYAVYLAFKCRAPFIEFLASCCCAPFYVAYVYGVKGGCYFVLPFLGPTTVRDSIGMVIDNNYLDPFAKVTWHEKEIKNISGTKIDYVGVKAASAVDFRSDNMTNFESLEKNSIDLYAASKSLYLQNRKNKINNSSENEDDWGNLDN